MNMNVIDLFAGIMLVAGDLIALICLAGSTLVFATGLLSYFTKKRIRFGEQELQWSIMGLVFGVGGQLCLMNSPQIKDANLEGVFVRIPFQTANLLLLASFCLLTLGFLLRRVAKNRAGYISSIPNKRTSARKHLATGKEFDPVAPSRKDLTGARQRNKAITIPNHAFEREIAWVFNTLYPVKVLVDDPPKGKINIKLYNDQDKLVGIVQASQDEENKLLPPGVLSTINSYRSKANIAKAFFVTTAMFRDDTAAQAKDMGISLVDGPLLNEWRRRARAKAPQQQSHITTN